MSTPSDRPASRRHAARAMPYPARGGAYRLQRGSLVAVAPEPIPEPIRPPSQPKGKGGTTPDTKE